MRAASLSVLALPDLARPTIMTGLNPMIQTFAASAEYVDSKSNVWSSRGRAMAPSFVIFESVTSAVTILPLNSRLSWIETQKTGVVFVLGGSSE